MLEALESHVVDAVLIDTYSMTSVKSIIENKNQRVKALIKTNTGFGFILSGLSPALQADLESLIQGRQNEITEFVASLKHKIPVRSIM